MTVQHPDTLAHLGICDAEADFYASKALLLYPERVYAIVGYVSVDRSSASTSGALARGIGLDPSYFNRGALLRALKRAIESRRPLHDTEHQDLGAPRHGR